MNNSEKPDFEANIKRLVYAFHSVGAFGFAPNSEYQWEALWGKYRCDGILPQYNTHESNWKERLPLDEIIAAAPDLLKENQSLKDRVKELEQEAFFIKLHRDSAQEDASSLRAIIKSLEAENEELRKKIELDNDRLKGYTD